MNAPLSKSDQVTRAGQIPEIALSAAWHYGQIPEHLVTEDGTPIRIVHRGTWTHGLGPDFADALLLFDERELRSGSVEIHLETRGWREHGHQGDPVYNSVILHVVARHDGSETRRADGGLIPVVEVSLPDSSLMPLALLDWNRVGGSVCAPTLVRTDPTRLRDILHGLGDTRLAARSAQLEATLADLPPEEVLWQAILGGLGYSRNQSPMRRLASLLPIATLNELRQSRPLSEWRDVTLGLLLGVAGFLPLAPVEANLLKLSPGTLQALENSWRRLGSPWQFERLTAAEWDRARVRPANHPLLRIHAAAALAHNVASAGGLLAAITDLLENPDFVTNFCGLTRQGTLPGIGRDRGIEILASEILPVLLAISVSTGNDALGESAARAWETLPIPAATSTTTRAMCQVCGSATIRGLGARGAQGLIHLDTVLCLPRRCFECPVANAELAVNE